MGPCSHARWCYPYMQRMSTIVGSGRVASDPYRFCIILPLMRNFFARRTSWNLTTNRYTEALEAHRRAGREVLDLTASNPTTVGLHYREDELLNALAHREALTYDPQAERTADCARGSVSLLRSARKSGLARQSHPDHQHQRGVFVPFPAAVRSGRHGAGPDPKLPAVRFPRRSPGREARAVRTGV